MNGVREEYGVKFTQTAKGVWYCDNLTVYKESIECAISTADDAITMVEDVLKKHNYPNYEDKKEEK